MTGRSRVATRVPVAGRPKRRTMVSRISQTRCRWPDGAPTHQDADRDVSIRPSAAIEGRSPTSRRHSQPPRHGPPAATGGIGSHHRPLAPRKAPAATRRRPKPRDIAGKHSGSTRQTLPLLAKSVVTGHSTEAAASRNAQSVDSVAISPERRDSPAASASIDSSRASNLTVQRSQPGSSKNDRRVALLRGGIPFRFWLGREVLGVPICYSGYRRPRREPRGRGSAGCLRRGLPLIRNRQR